MIYSAYAGSVALEGYTTSANYLEGDTFDQCGGHSSSAESSSYHYHVAPSCLLAQLDDLSDGHSPQIGWMADGFPLYGPLGPGGVGWKKVVFDNNDIAINGNTAQAMGEYYFYSAGDDSVSKVEYTFGYKRHDDGQIRIYLHHSSLPYQKH